jgi:hypothetical protein
MKTPEVEQRYQVAAGLQKVHASKYKINCNSSTDILFVKTA